MKTFRIFEHSQHGKEAVKVGFSWPAFFLGILWVSILWMLFKGLWRIVGMFFAILIVMVFVVNAIKAGVYDPQLKLILEYAVPAGAYAIMLLIPAFKGNDWRARKLTNDGYVLRDTVHASSPVQALRSWETG